MSARIKYWKLLQLLKEKGFWFFDVEPTFSNFCSCFKLDKKGTELDAVEVLPHILVMGGLSKFVIVDEAQNWVLKGEFTDGEHEIEKERETYKTAGPARKYLLKNKKAFALNGVQYYLQRKCAILDIYYLSNLAERKSEVGPQSDSQTKMWALFKTLYGPRAHNTFHSWCDNNNIVDLHSGNWSFYKNKLVVIDYGN